MTLLNLKFFKHIAAGMLLLVGLSSQAWAQEGRFNPVAGSKHLMSFDLQRASEAVFFLNSSSGRCTGTFISNAGHFLTARHCLQRCLLSSGVFKFAGGLRGEPAYLILDKEAYGKKSCSVQIDSENVDIVIEGTSEGFITKMDERSFQTQNPEKFEDLVKRGFTFRGDFVIGKALKKRPSACVHLSKYTPRVGDEFVNIAYPSQTLRGDGHDSDGVQKYWSKGKRIQGIAENSCVASSDISSNKLKELQNIFDDEASAVLTVDAIYGSSGSAVFDSNAQVEAILTNVFRYSSITGSSDNEPEKYYCQGSAKGLRLTEIRMLLDRQGLDLAKLNDCSAL